MTVERWTIEHAMQEDGLHGVDGWRVVRGSEIADDSFSQDEDTARLMADRLNREDAAEVEHWWIVIDDEGGMQARIRPLPAGPRRHGTREIKVAPAAELDRLRSCIAAALERVEVLPSDDGGEAEAILREALDGRPE